MPIRSQGVHAWVGAKWRRLFTRTVLAFAGITALGACGHADPPAGASGGPSQGAAASAGGDRSAESVRVPGDPAHAGSALGSLQPERDNDDDDDTPARKWRKVADGTLRMTVVIEGHGKFGDRENNEEITLRRRLEVTSRMHGSAIPAEVAERSSPLADVGKAMDKCGDNETCRQAAAMRLLQMTPAQRQAVSDLADRQLAALDRNTEWERMAPCSATVSVDDSGISAGMTTEGYLAVPESRKGTHTFDCADGFPDTGIKGPLIMVDADAGTYDLRLPDVHTLATGTFQYRVEQHPRQVYLSPLEINKQKFETLDRPLTGTVQLHPPPSRAMASEGNPVKVTATVSWTFTPDDR